MLISQNELSIYVTGCQFSPRAACVFEYLHNVEINYFVFTASKRSLMDSIKRAIQGQS